MFPFFPDIPFSLPEAKRREVRGEPSGYPGVPQRRESVGFYSGAYPEHPTSFSLKASYPGFI